MLDFTWQIIVLIQNLASSHLLFPEQVGTGAITGDIAAGTGAA